MIVFKFFTFKPKLSALVTFFIFFVIIFLRLRSRNMNILTEFNLVRILIFCSTIIILSIALIVLLNDLFKFIIPKESKNTLVLWFKNLNQNIQETIQNILILTYSKYFESYMEKLIINLTGALVKIAPYSRVIHFFTISLPTLIVGISYFYDVVIKKEFYVFPRIAFILIFPLLISIIVWVVKYQHTKLLAFYEAQNALYHPRSPNPLATPMDAEAHLAWLEDILAWYSVSEFIKKTCEHFSEGWWEKKASIILRHALFIISSAHLIYYMYDHQSVQLITNILVYKLHVSLIQIPTKDMLDLWVLIQ